MLCNEVKGKWSKTLQQLASQECVGNGIDSNERGGWLEDVYEWLQVSVVAIEAMLSVNSWSRGRSNNGSAHRLRVWHLMQFKCEGPVRWLRQWLGRAHSKCHLWWKSIPPQESTVHLIAKDGEGHYAWYLLKRVRRRKVERKAVKALVVCEYVYMQCVYSNKPDQTMEGRRKAVWERQREEGRTPFCQRHCLSCILMSLLFWFISLSSFYFFFYWAVRCK